MAAARAQVAGVEEVDRRAPRDRRGSWGVLIWKEAGQACSWPPSITRSSTSALRSRDPVDSYSPDYAQAAGAAVRESRAERGIPVSRQRGRRVDGGEPDRGQARGPVPRDTYSAHQGVRHDGMNVLLGGRARRRAGPRADPRVLEARFTGEARHLRLLASCWPRWRTGADRRARSVRPVRLGSTTEAQARAPRKSWTRKTLYETLAVRDIQDAAGRPATCGVYEQTGGRDGYVNLKASPRSWRTTRRARWPRPAGLGSVVGREGHDLRASGHRPALRGHDGEASAGGPAADAPADRPPARRDQSGRRKVDGGLRAAGAAPQAAARCAGVGATARPCAQRSSAPRRSGSPRPRRATWRR